MTLESQELSHISHVSITREPRALVATIPETRGLSRSSWGEGRGRTQRPAARAEQARPPSPFPQGRGVSSSGGFLGPLPQHSTLPGSQGQGRRTETLRQLSVPLGLTHLPRGGQAAQKLLVGGGGGVRGRGGAATVAPKGRPQLNAISCPCPGLALTLGYAYGIRTMPRALSSPEHCTGSLAFDPGIITKFKVAGLHD